MDIMALLTKSSDPSSTGSRWPGGFRVGGSRFRGSKVQNLGYRFRFEILGYSAQSSETLLRAQLQRTLPTMAERWLLLHGFCLSIRAAPMCAAVTMLKPSCKDLAIRLSPFEERLRCLWAVARRTSRKLLEGLVKVIQG